MSDDLPLYHQHATATNAKSVTIAAFQERWSGTAPEAGRAGSTGLGSGCSRRWRRRGARVICESPKGIDKVAGGNAPGKQARPVARTSARVAMPPIPRRGLIK